MWLNKNGFLKNQIEGGLMFLDASAQAYDVLYNNYIYIISE